MNALLNRGTKFEAGHQPHKALPEVKKKCLTTPYTHTATQSYQLQLYSVVC